MEVFARILFLQGIRMKAIIPNNCLKYVGLQYNGKQEQYHNPKEVKICEKLLANTNPKNILEIGCGIGRVSVGFFKHYPSWKNTNFYMLDGDSGDKQIAGTSSTDGGYYNRLAATKEYCIANGIQNDKVFCIDAASNDLSQMPIFDCVYSFYAIGFHWPISFYIDKLLPIIRQGTILCFGMREYGFKKFTDGQILSVSDKLFFKNRQANLLILIRK